MSEHDVRREEQNQLEARTPTASERFTANVMKQFEAEAGSPMKFTDYEKTLAQHLFLKIDSTLKDMEKKRQDSNQTNKAPFTWQNVNMRKLALDAVHRVQLGLDALIPAHVYPVPYFNGKEKLYDIDLRVGYRGELYYRMEAATEKPLDVRLELVYDTDTFIPVMKDFRNQVEGYEFKVNNPFARGKVIGGFAYIMYADERKNKLVLVSEDMFLKSRAAAQSKDFWDKYPVEMRFKTLVHRAMSNLPIDPKKVNAAAFAAVEDDAVENEIDRNANGDPIIIAEMVEDDDGNVYAEDPVVQKQEAIQAHPATPDF